MYQDLLQDASFFEFLRRMDVDLAESARSIGCPCGGVLHSARYRRKPRGGPASLSRECSVRESFCCSQDGCRRRSMPPSVLFLGRRVFFGVIVVLVPILREGLTPGRFRRLEKQLVVSRRTVRRWQRWWREMMPWTVLWRRARADLGLEVVAASLPGSLVSSFTEATEGRDRLYAVLMWLSDPGLFSGPDGHAR